MEESNPECIRCNGSGHLFKDPNNKHGSETTWCRCGKWLNGIENHWTSSINPFTRKKWEDLE